MATLSLGKCRNRGRYLALVLSSECCAMIIIAWEMVMLCSLIKELGISSPFSMPKYYYNQAAILINSNSTFHECTKHIKIDYHYIHDKVMFRLILYSSCGIILLAYRCFYPKPSRDLRHCHMHQARHISLICSSLRWSVFRYYQIPSPLWPVISLSPFSYLNQCILLFFFQTL